MTCHPGDMERFLRRAVKVTGLTPIPSMPEQPNPLINEAYGEGIVIIAESHITVTVRGDRCFLACFSCKDFPWPRVRNAARSIFGGQWTTQYFERSQPPSGLTRPGSSSGQGRSALHRLWWVGRHGGNRKDKGDGKDQ